MSRIVVVKREGWLENLFHLMSLYHGKVTQVTV